MGPCDARSSRGRRSPRKQEPSPRRLSTSRRSVAAGPGGHFLVPGRPPFDPAGPPQCASHLAGQMSGSQPTTTDLKENICLNSPSPISLRQRGSPVCPSHQSATPGIPRGGGISFPAPTRPVPSRHFLFEFHLAGHPVPASARPRARAGTGTRRDRLPVPHPPVRVLHGAPAIRVRRVPTEPSRYDPAVHRCRGADPAGLVPVHVPDRPAGGTVAAGNIGRPVPAGRHKPSRSNRVFGRLDESLA